MTSFVLPSLSWEDQGQVHGLPWHSLAGVPAPKRVVAADDRITADAAYQLICAGTALLWRGDYHNARQLLAALARRCERSTAKSRHRTSRKNQQQAGFVGTDGTDLGSVCDQFHQFRLQQAQRARLLGRLLLPFAPGHRLDLRRAPDVALACREALDPALPAMAATLESTPYAASLRELLGVVGAYEWRKKGVLVPALGIDARIHPYYGVFSPLRSEYLQLLQETPLPVVVQQGALAFDLGTGSGVIAGLLAQRGVASIVATDISTRAIACAKDNLERLGWARQVRVEQCDLFPAMEHGRAGLIICNPPWLPGKAASLLEASSYDEASRMLKAYLAGLKSYLCDGGEGWLILSDLAEHLGLRRREDLLAWIAAAGLRVLSRKDIRPQHAKAFDVKDPLYAARSQELTSLWRLGLA